MEVYSSVEIIEENNEFRYIPSVIHFSTIIELNLEELTQDFLKGQLDKVRLKKAACIEYEVSAMITNTFTNNTTHLNGSHLDRLVIKDAFPSYISITSNFTVTAYLLTRIGNVIANKTFI